MTATACRYQYFKLLYNLPGTLARPTGATRLGADSNRSAGVNDPCRGEESSTVLLDRTRHG